MYRLNLALLAEDATNKIISLLPPIRPPQSSSFGRGCDLGGGTKNQLAIDRLNLALLAEDATKRFLRG